MLLKINRKIINTLIVSSLYIGGGFVANLSQLNASQEQLQLQKLLDAFPASKINWKEISEIISANPELLTAQNSNGRTALHSVMQCKDPDVVKKFVELIPKKDRIVLLSTKGKYKCPPPYLAVGLGNLGAVKVLIELIPEKDRKAFLNIPDVNNEQTLLHRAMEQRDVNIIKALLEPTPEKDRIDCLSMKDKDNEWTPLHWAVWTRKLDIVEALIKFIPEKDGMAFLKIRDNKGWTPLAWAMVRAKAKAMEAEKDEAIIVALTSKFDANKLASHIKTYRDKDGRTLLHLAVLGGKCDRVKWIVDALGKKSKKTLIKIMNYKDEFKQTPLQLAKSLAKGNSSNERTTIIKFLEETEKSNEVKKVKNKL
ncbi:MAG: ankyrin repeat domain-containing protein [Puniceicoccales bacterium]|jgi:ankyrin repeat protein|nr:ankyrin repeat domain-containing protein [Puniceicoccales bacterium]